jgi:4-amino-4-deoxy-L-arabinose transferase-like glycosyltransferase
VEGWVEESQSDHPIPIRTALKFWHLGALLGTAFLLRAGYGLYLPNELLLSDAHSFDAIAWNVASEGRYALAGHPTAIRPPGYVLYLATIYKLAGHRYRAARLAQALLGVGLVGVLMAIAKELGWSSRVVWGVGWMAALYPFFIYYESQLIADAYLTFWHAVALWTTLRWIHRPESIPRASLMGLSFSVLCLTKSIYVPLLVLVLAVEGYRCFRQTDAIPWTSLLVASVAFLVPLGLWAARNEDQLGRYLLDSHGGQTTVETIVFHERVKDGTFPQIWKNLPLRKGIESLPEENREEAYLQVTHRFIREHVGLYAKQSLVRLKDFWRFYPRQDITFRESRPFITVISLLTEPFLILMGFWVLARTWRKASTYYPFYATILLTTAVYALVTGQMRYRLPLMPVLILFTAYGLFTPKNRSSDH